MPARRNKYKPEFKAKVTIEALKGDKSSAELAQIYGVHPAHAVLVSVPVQLTCPPACRLRWPLTPCKCHLEMSVGTLISPILQTVAVPFGIGHHAVM